MKLVHDGLSAVRVAENLASRAKWVGLCTFNIDPKAALFRLHMPKGSQLIIGLPATSIAAWEAGSWLKAERPDLEIVGKTECHAKYALFDRGKNRWLMFGSANMTNSPADECVFFYQNPPNNLWDAVLALHQRLIKRGRVIPPMQKRQPLTREQLRSLSSKTVVT